MSIRISSLKCDQLNCEHSVCTIDSSVNISAYDVKRIKSLFNIYGKSEKVDVSFQDDVEEYRFRKIITK